MTTSSHAEGSALFPHCFRLVSAVFPPCCRLVSSPLSVGLRSHLKGAFPPPLQHMLCDGTHKSFWGEHENRRGPAHRHMCVCVCVCVCVYIYLYIHILNFVPVRTIKGSSSYTHTYTTQWSPAISRDASRCTVVQVASTDERKRVRLQSDFNLCDFTLALPAASHAAGPNARRADVRLGVPTSPRPDPPHSSEPPVKSTLPSPQPHHTTLRNTKPRRSPTQTRRCNHATKIHKVLLAVQRRSSFYYHSLVGLF